jgi:hypothetical protein
MTDPYDWQALVQKHLDGRTNEEEAAALSTQIVENEDVRSLYLKAAQLHSALADEVLALDFETAPPSAAEPQSVVRSSSNSKPRQVAAGVLAGLFVGVLGAGMVWAIGSPKAEAWALNVAHGSFDSLPTGPIPRGFSAQFGEWSGDPLEVTEEADGNRHLRFMETGNVKGDPKGGASACNAFQFIDLAALRHQWQADDPDAQHTLELSAHFVSKPSSVDEAFPNLRADCRIYLFDTDPQSVVDGWPHVVTEAVAVAKKRVRLKPGTHSGSVLASCILEPEATVALITLDVGVGMQTTTPIKLGNYFADDVELTLTRQPKLPVRVVQLAK